MPLLNHSHPKPKGIFKYGTKIFEVTTPETRYTVGWELATSYIKRRFITRKILATFVRKQWVLCYKGSKTRICVKEICTKEIDDYLGL